MRKNSFTTHDDNAIYLCLSNSQTSVILNKLPVRAVFFHRFEDGCSKNMKTMITVFMILFPLIKGPQNLQGNGYHEPITG